jgi:hypothetical protein
LSKLPNFLCSVFVIAGEGQFCVYLALLGRWKNFLKSELYVSCQMSAVLPDIFVKKNAS